ncbi:MAG: hypothetical protein CMM01_07635 [Rhodopirellula sp.]|nr:hypothetical protein [Rhodopirellula sp.]
MRFDSLNIPAFGPFTSCSYDFEPSSHDLHVIYGPNEAGKSSLLRGIHHLLYGFPASTDDDFLHEYKKLRIGATVSDGAQSLTFLRKKGNVGTLLDAKQNSIDEGRLKAFCGSVSPEFFSQMFGLSTETLRSGADSLLSSQGELGALLFAASAGGAPIESAIQKLQAEADKLFAGNGRKANTIVTAYAAVKKHEKELRANSLSTAEWKRLNQEIDSAQREFDSKDEQLNKCRMRQTRVQSLLKAIPLIHALQTTHAALATITLPHLPSDFPARVTEANSTLANATALISEHETSLLSKQARLVEITPFENIVRDAPELDSLHQTITQHLNDLQNLETLQGKLRQLQHEQQLQLQSMELKDRETLSALPNVGKKQLHGIKQLVESIAIVERKRDQARHDFNGTTSALAKQQQKLAALGEAKINDSLRALSSEVEEHNKNSKVALTWQDQRDDREISLQQLTNQLGIGYLSADEARKLQVPALTVVEQFQKDENRIKEDLRLAQQMLDDLKTSAVEIEAEIRAGSDNVAVVTKNDLVDARTARDEYWNQLSQKLIDKKAVETGEAEALSRKIVESDQIADTLRDHAEMIGKLTTLQRRLTSNAEKQKQVEQTVARIKDTQTVFETKWRQHSSFLPGRHFIPIELNAWLVHWDTWLNLDAEMSSLEKKLQANRAKEEELCDALRKSLQRNGESYTILATCLSNRLSEAESVNGERKAIRVDIEASNSDLSAQREAFTQAEQKLASAIDDWTASLSEFQINNTALRNVALNQLEARHTAHATDRDISACVEQVASITRRIESYTEDLEKYRSRHLPDSASLDPANPQITEKRLADLLASAQVRRTEHETLIRDIVQVKEILRAKERAKDAATLQIQQLMTEANVDFPEGLPDAITQFENQQRLRQKLELTKAALNNLAGSMGVDALIKEAEAEESDSLQIEVRTLAEEIEGLQALRDSARDVLNDARKARAKLEKATDEAAVAKQFSANALATVITQSERFIRLQHSIAFLRAQVEAYRKKTQGPMIEKTSEFFSTLTNGAFSGVGAQQDDGDPDQIHLVALRDTIEESVATPDSLNTQALSEGTRDQLYLALRMAAIDIHLEHHAPMPLILDDVLMTFDESRSKAFFKLMKTLSRKTQVIVFTHHQHTANMASQFISTEQILRLGANSNA